MEAGALRKTSSMRLVHFWVCWEGLLHPLQEREQLCLRIRPILHMQPFQTVDVPGSGISSRDTPPWSHQTPSNSPLGEFHTKDFTREKPSLKCWMLRTLHPFHEDPHVRKINPDGRRFNAACGHSPLGGLWRS